MGESNPASLGEACEGERAGPSLPAGLPPAFHVLLRRPPPAVTWIYSVDHMGKSEEEVWDGAG